jgi:hypothetical protein
MLALVVTQKWRSLWAAFQVLASTKRWTTTIRASGIECIGGSGSNWKISKAVPFEESKKKKASDVTISLQ